MAISSTPAGSVSKPSRPEKIFKCRVRFDAGRTQVTLLRSWFEMPLQTGDPELIDLYRQHLDQLQQQIELKHPLGDRLHRLFVHRHGQLPDLDESARILGVRPRTLRRRLQQQGQSFGGLLAEFRAKSACALVLAGSTAAQDIALQLGFDDVNAFRRAFKTWTGKSVNQYRAQARLLTS